MAKAPDKAAPKNAATKSAATKIGPHLLGIKGLSREQIEFLLDSAEQFVEVGQRNVKKVPALRGKTVINLFFEPSTRTRMSFELAAKRLSADAINFSASSSSSTKGESVIDTALTIQAMNPDVVVVRHSSSGVPSLIAKHLKTCSVVNAGDGLHAHPSQALLDALTIRRKLGSLDKLTVSFVGDSLRSRVVRSNIHLLKTFGCKIRLVGPPTLAIKEFEKMGVSVHSDMASGLKGADVIVSLRMKHEYLKDYFIPSLEEYSKHYCITQERINNHCPGAIVLAPGPIIRGTEISAEVAEGAQSLIETQVEMGVAVRMAILFNLTHGNSEERNTEEKNTEDKGDL